MKAIVAVDKNWGIGKNNDLLFHLKKDMAFFRATTLNKVVVMGSNTLKSFPNGKPLKDRINIVLYPNGEKREDCIIVGSLEELFATLKNYPSEDIFVVGGAMFYRTMLPFCDTVYVTKVFADGDATVFYENLDNLPEWSIESMSEKETDGEYEIAFCTYVNKNVKNF
ncbi:dihydrofolate reductase [bacterium]|nr:dihydrofolate reductase [bacterium]